MSEQQPEQVALHDPNEVLDENDIGELVEDDVDLTDIWVEGVEE